MASASLRWPILATDMASGALRRLGALVLLVGAGVVVAIEDGVIHQIEVVAALLWIGRRCVASRACLALAAAVGALSRRVLLGVSAWGRRRKTALARWHQWRRGQPPPLEIAHRV